MSREGIEGFTKYLIENQEYQNKVRSFGGDIEKLMNSAREMGYDVSAEEFREYQDKARQILRGRINKKMSDASISPGAKEFYNFIKMAESDIEIAKRVAELGYRTPEELIAYGKEKGFTFTEADMDAVSKDVLEPQNELSEEELEMVAGGSTLLGVALMIAAACAIAGGGVGLGLAAGIAAGAGAVVGITALLG